MNNFQRLMEEEERKAPKAPPFVENNVEGTLGMFRFIGQIVEVYLPRFSNILVNLVGGSESERAEPTDVVERRVMPHDEGRRGHRGPDSHSPDIPPSRQ